MTSLRARAEHEGHARAPPPRLPPALLRLHHQNYLQTQDCRYQSAASSLGDSSLFFSARVFRGEIDENQSHSLRTSPCTCTRAPCLVNVLRSKLWVCECEAGWKLQLLLTELWMSLFFFFLFCYITAFPPLIQTRCLPVLIRSLSADCRSGCGHPAARKLPERPHADSERIQSRPRSGKETDFAGLSQNWDVIFQDELQFKRPVSSHPRNV